MRLYTEMDWESSKYRNHALNAGIIFLGLATLVLAFAFFNRIGSPRPDATRVYNPDGFYGDIIQVEVLNGCGVSGLAGQMTEFLRSYGFDVVDHGDHTSFDIEETVIVDRIGNLDAAKQVALALGLQESSIIQEVRSDYYLDVSVIIGLDYQAIMPFMDNAE